MPASRYRDDAQRCVRLLALRALAERNWPLLHLCFSACHPGELDDLKFRRGCCRFWHGPLTADDLPWQDGLQWEQDLRTDRWFPVSPGTCSVTGEECRKRGCDVQCSTWNSAVFGEDRS